jgi:uncharacterized Zn finger protein (UPF0148 family)
MAAWMFKHTGYCPVCENTTRFESENDWFRDF